MKYCNTRLGPYPTQYEYDSRALSTLGTNSVAQAILSDGRLWGHILTSTGVNLGG